MFYKSTRIAAALGALALLLLPAAPSPARAQSILLPIVPSPAWEETAITRNCVGTRGSPSCVTTFRRFNPTPHVTRVPTPIAEQEVSEHRQREKRWEELCKPTIRQDQYGVSRYYYAARGCEFGKLD
jgi:hypothetical protein